MTLECRKTNPLNRRASPVCFVHVEPFKKHNKQISDKQYVYKHWGYPSIYFIAPERDLGALCNL